MRCTFHGQWAAVMAWLSVVSKRYSLNSPGMGDHQLSGLQVQLYYGVKMPYSITAIDGFIAPGHVSVVIGSGVFEELARETGLPFAVAGFEGPGLLAAIGALVKMRGQARCINRYKSVVTREGNVEGQALMNKYFEEAPAVWRGMGEIASSGRLIRPEFAAFDAGSRGLDDDQKINKACSCDKVLMGKMRPDECPLFRKVCSPLTPQGACMVSPEGSCHTAFMV